MDEPENYATADAIRRAFLDYVSEGPAQELPYQEVWRRLRSAGIHLRGTTAKKERDTVYKALLGSSEIVKVRPGVFAPRGQASAEGDG